MQKRHLLFVLTAILLIATSIFSPLVTKINYEQKHKGFVTALSLNDLSALYEDDALAEVLLDYKQSGMQALILHVHNGQVDTDLLAQAKATDMELGLVLYADISCTDTYTAYIADLVNTYSVRYVLLKNATENKDISNLAKLFDGDNAPVLVLCENESQLSNESPLGTDKCIAKANGRILRAYETKKAPGGDWDTIHYQMLNSARDRNTEFLLINQRTDAAATPDGNAVATQKATQKFDAWMQKAGYIPGFAGTLQGYTVNARTVNAAAAAIGVLMLVFMLHYLFGKLSARIDWSLYILALLVYAATYLMPNTLLQFYPTLFALLGACFSMTLTFFVAEKAKDKLPYIGYIPAIIGTALLALLICSAILSSMLSGMEYYLNIYIFRGTRLTLLLPVLYAAFLLLIRSRQKLPTFSVLRQHWHTMRKKIRLWHILICIAAIGCVALYLLRSGNTNISAVERSIRNAIAEFSMARPRTKEFLIGWPALALFALAMKNNRSKLLTMAFALISSVLFASVMNTFCHVFADYITSLSRTLNGLIFAIPLILICLAANRMFLNLISKRNLDRQKGL